MPENEKIKKRINPGLLRKIRISPGLFERPFLQGQVGQLQGRVSVNKVHFLFRLCVHVGSAVLVVQSQKACEGLRKERAVKGRNEKTGRAQAGVFPQVIPGFF